MKNRLEHHVNKILSHWNPIGVPKELASSEYKAYVPKILKNCKTEKKINIVLKEILLDMGLDYKKNLNELIKLSSLIVKICTKSNK